MPIELFTWAKSPHWWRLLLVAALLSVAGTAAAATPSASTLLRSGTQAYQRYYTTLQHLHWRDVIAPAHLTPAGVREGLRITAMASGALHTYATAEQRVMAKVGHLATSSQGTSVVARAMTRYVKRDMIHERQKIRAVKQVLTMLAARPDAWHMDKRHLVFNKPGGKSARTVYQALATVHQTVMASRADRAQLKKAVAGHKALLLRLDPDIL